MLGIGNLIMTDDGIGVRVIHALQERFRFPDSVTVLDGGTLGLDLLPKFEGVDRLLIVDAVETGAEPGTMVRLVGEEIPIVMATKLSPHQMGLKDMLSVASLMGCVPREMVLLGVQPESIEMGTELSPTLAAVVDSLVTGVVAELRNWNVASETS